ncbi:MAG: OmpA family protein [Saprospiraceae bacterium]|nr:OmpA family protein [Saprospiraceae bacterium]
MSKQVYLIGASILVTIFATNTACVGKKKFRAELANRDSLTHFLNVRNLELNREIGQLKLNLAEKTGEANGLTTIYDKQVLEIKKLEKEIERLNSQSSNTQQSLNEEVRKRDSQLADKEQLIQNFGIALQKQEGSIDAISVEFREALANLPAADFYLDHKDYKGYLGISEKQLFRPSTDQLARSANAVLEKIAKVLNNHPELQVQVIGHSDSQSGYKGFQSRLDFSTSRAVAVSDVLTRDFYVNGSQITAAGRSDFEPRASNETEDGRSQNRRIEIVFQPRADEVRRMASDVKKD